VRLESKKESIASYWYQEGRRRAGRKKSRKYAKFLKKRMSKLRRLRK
jgi:hypothetical protein